jgi:hypothetical protein
MLNSPLSLPSKLTWVKSARRNSLSARFNILPYDTTKPPFFASASEQTMDPIQLWCEQNNCGIRTSFDTFKFNNKAEMTMFLLRWGS